MASAKNSETEPQLPQNSNFQSTESYLQSIISPLSNLDLDDWKTKAGFLGIFSLGIFGGLGYGMRSAQSKDPKAYTEAMKHEPVHKFARRAFYYGSLWAVGGCSVLFGSVWLALGRPSPKEFGKMMQENLPNPTKARLQEWQIESNYLRRLSHNKPEVPLENEKHLPEWLKNEIKKDDSKS